MNPHFGPLVLLDDGTSAPAGGSPAPAGSSPAPAPSSSPAGGATPPEGAGDAPSDTSSAPAGGDQDPFDGMESDDFDAIDLGMQDADTGDEPGSAAPAPPAAGAEGEPPKPATVASPAAPQTPVVPPTAPAAPAANVTTPPRSQLEAALDGFKGQTNQTALADWASRELFKLSDEDVAAYEAAPGELIPKLMGRVYTRAMESAVNLIKNLVPEIVNSGITTQQVRAARANEALSEFYQANPHLSADQHGAAVDRWARSFRATNPQASRQEAISFVGKAVSAEFGVWPGATNGSAAPARRAAPFAPARQGGRAPAQARGSHDPYAGMEDDLDG